MYVPSFNFLGLSVSKKSVTNIFNVWKLDRKKNEEIKGWISYNNLILADIIQPPIVHDST